LTYFSSIKSKNLFLLTHEKKSSDETDKKKPSDDMDDEEGWSMIPKKRFFK